MYFPQSEIQFCFRSGRSESFPSFFYLCPHFKAPEDEIPPYKGAAIRFWLYKK